MQPRQQFGPPILAFVLLAAILAGGCACPCPRCTPTTSPGWQPGCDAPNVCFGHVSTCWRMWPRECATCPSYAAVQLAASEAVPRKDVPTAPPMLPAETPREEKALQSVVEPDRSSAAPPNNEINRIFRLAVPPSLSSYQPQPMGER